MQDIVVGRRPTEESGTFPLATGPLVEAVDVVVGARSSCPLSFSVGTGEIVGLLLPLTTPRCPLLRVLAGLDAPTAGEVRLGSGRVCVVTTSRGLSEALAAQPDLVLFDAGDGAGNRDTWARLAAERALGTSFVIATSSLDQACRSDRVSLASWDGYQLRRTLTELSSQLALETQELVGALAEGRVPRTGALAADLRRLKIGSRALLAEMGRCARARDETTAWYAAARRLETVSLDDRMLEALIADVQDRD
jgi:hypothetical protein